MSDRVVYCFAVNSARLALGARFPGAQPTPAAPGVTIDTSPRHRELGMTVGANALSGAGPTEARLRRRLERIREQDSDALAQLYDETASRLFGFAMRILNDSADAEEIVLDVYQQVWKSAHTFDGSRGTVWSWLVILTRSRALDRVRSAGFRQKRSMQTGLEIESGSPSPEFQIIYAEKREIISQALEELSAGERTAIELAYFGGLTHVEIAEALGEPLGTIKTRIRSGMRKLRAAIGPIFRS